MNNIYNSVSVPTGTPTVVNGITVPTRSGYSLKGLIVSCDANCEILINLNVTAIASGKITGTNPTLFLDFSASPYGLGAADVVAVVATQNDPLTSPAGTYTVTSTLLVEQL